MSMTGLADSSATAVLRICSISATSHSSRVVRSTFASESNSSAHSAECGRIVMGASSAVGEPMMLAVRPNVEVKPRHACALALLDGQLILSPLPCEELH